MVIKIDEEPENIITACQVLREEESSRGAEHSNAGSLKTPLSGNTP